MIEQIQEKLMTNFFFKFKKSFFLPISPTFLGKKSFSKKSGSVMHNLIKVSSTMSKFRET